jgi:hypothetical protein
LIIFMRLIIGIWLIPPRHRLLVIIYTNIKKKKRY